MTKEEIRARREAGGFDSARTGSENRLSRMRGASKHARAFNDKRERRIAALQMYHDRMAGANYNELCAKWKVSRETAQKMIKEIMSDDLVQQLERRILESVVPLAIEVYTKKLQEGSEFVAKDVLGNFAKIADRSIKREELAQKNKEEEDSLEFLLQIKGKRNFKPAEDTQPEEVLDVQSRPIAAIEAAVSESVETTVRGDLQAVGGQQAATSLLGQGRPKEGLPAAIRKRNGGSFTSIRDILREELV